MLRLEDAATPPSGRGAVTSSTEVTSCFAKVDEGHIVDEDTEHIMI